jgi:hypothetical protein
LKCLDDWIKIVTFNSQNLCSIHPDRGSCA